MDRTHEALKAHTCIDDLFCKGFEATVRFAVILHEDDIPNFDDLRMIFIHEFPSGYFRTLFSRTTIHMDL